jgi:hypothetical protein
MTQEQNAPVQDSSAGSSARGNLRKTLLAAMLTSSTLVACSGEPLHEGEAVEDVASTITGGSLVTAAMQNENHVAATLKFARFLDSRTCTAIKVAPFRLFTAAHCITELNLVAGDALSITNSLGGSFTDNQAYNPVIVAGVHAHPSFRSFNDGQLAFDVGIIDLGPEIPTTNIPVLASNPQINSLFFRDFQFGRLISYGADDASNNDGRKQWADFKSAPRSSLPFDNEGDWSSSYAHNIVSLTPNLEVAGGDSGGPLFVQFEQGWRVSGFVSASFDNAEMSEFARAASVRRWLANPTATNVISNGAVGALLNRGSRRCIAVSPSAGSNGVPRELFCDGVQVEDDQSWRLVSIAANRFRIQNVFTGHCFGIFPGTTNVVLETCNGASQSWEFVSQNSGTSYRIRNEQANACLRRHPDPRAGLRLQVATCQNVEDQRYVFHP